MTYDTQKPMWDTAPRWAQWLTQDGDGTWYWYEREPHWIDEDNMYDETSGGCCALARDGIVEPGHKEQRP